ncbi:MAG: multiubiquitin domain-containing protein, partial [Planctomycetaceae bacterium]|nr:multiubiquitin domain-containing protein [Planctomycetaceae bacterium]
EIAERINREVAERITGEIAERIDREVAERVTREIAERINREVAERVTREIAERMTTDVARRMTGEVVERTTQEVTERITGDDAGHITRRLNIEGQEYPWDRDTITVREIRQLGSLPVDAQVLEINLEDNTERTLNETEVVEIKSGYGYAKKVRYRRGRTLR